MSGWSLAIRTGNASMGILPHKWPWHWAYALVLDRRWEYISELGGAYGDEETGGDAAEVPPEIWHDRKRVDEWVETRKKARKQKNDEQMR